MKLLAVVSVVLIACAHAPPASSPPVAPSEAEILARSHAFFAAWDRADRDAVFADAGPAFENFEDQRVADRALLEKFLAARTARHAPPHSRVWSEERVIVAPTSAVFLGHSVETIPAEGGHAAAERDGFETLVWTRDGERWLLAHWGWERAGLGAEREKWNDYFKTGRGFTVEPNKLLVAAVRGVAPGTALDISMGQGRNAVYLATLGWKVTGIDISDEGIRIAQDNAAKLHVALTTVQVDDAKYDYGTDRWDLVTLIYAGDDEAIVKKVIPSLKHGGLFVCEYFHADSEAAKGGAGGWKTGALAALFANGFEIVRDEVVEDKADWAGQRVTKLVRFVARKK